MLNPLYVSLRILIGNVPGSSHVDYGSIFYGRLDAFCQFLVAADSAPCMRKGSVQVSLVTDAAKATWVHLHVGSAQIAGSGSQKEFAGESRCVISAEVQRRSVVQRNSRKQLRQIRGSMLPS